jgi:type VI secretion system protein ImpF
MSTRPESRPARIDPRQGLKPSIIDRLIDPESEGTSWRHGYGLEQVVNSVRNDLEELLNSHRIDQDIPEELVEVRNSIVTYGLAELGSHQSAIPNLADRVGGAIEEAIARFEPRLRDVRAVLIDPKQVKQLRLEFQIQATLRVDPSPEVAFMTVLKLTTGETSIQQVID